ncbi:MAG: hypothetical protein CMJ49_10135 [Planctomycetaceae bacterium]|nr:hypothetical protein [Planctomycetaceae bacterium]
MSDPLLTVSDASTDVGADRPSGLIAPDCRHYVGVRPCAANRLCRGCAHYAPYRQRVCVIKLGALGDVIRTLCILPELRRRYPEAEVTWVTRANAARMIEGHPGIDRVLAFDAGTCMRLGAEWHDVVICLDKEAEPAALATSLPAATKLGFALSEWGTPVPGNDAAEACFVLGLSDRLKFAENRKSYPQLAYEALGWVYDGQRYELALGADDAAEAKRELGAKGWTPERLTLGVNVGAGAMFANKIWPAARMRQLLERIHQVYPSVQVVLLGGVEERSVMEELHGALGWTVHGGWDHDERGFLGLIDLCDVVFSGDTMAMHAAIARQRGVVAWFGPTCEQEIDLFGLGEKLIAETGCSPCYKRVCDQGDACVGSVSIEDTVSAIGRVMSQHGGTARVKLPAEMEAVRSLVAQVEWRAAG